MAATTMEVYGYLPGKPAARLGPVQLVGTAANIDGLGTRLLYLDTLSPRWDPAGGFVYPSGLGARHNRIMEATKS